MAESNLSLQIVIGVTAGLALLYMLWPSSNNNGGDSGEPVPEQEKLERLPVGKLTVETLKPYIGANNGRILVSVCGRIFDLTKARDFYGHPDGPYNCFAGSDASYMLGAMSLDKSNQNKKDFEQDGDHQMTLSDWISRFRAKYPIVGRLDGFENLCPESWREAGNDDVIDDVNVNEIYNNDFRYVSGKELADTAKYSSKHRWLSVCGVVFDVQSAESVYESLYGDFADAIGHDISAALMTHTFDAQTYDASIRKFDTDKTKLAKLKKYLQLFLETYPTVGFLDDADNKYRITNFGDVSPPSEWSLVEQNDAKPDVPAQAPPTANK
eukprot:CAMPEP_0202693716 /NCGR_PEP_ID=MMETSP1385-20130828/7762_1 /ASSEMBLY_ACC=CAM_ASM_000861 /TAXON_ID=933848 /ORGANISM="Elphidium margaritaceum" /LENGTH=324 /DNA_ID=CAMNT_0049349437 /DNA_START=6 /DNA_END=980 /DNA_ORIENTATION=+